MSDDPLVLSELTDIINQIELLGEQNKILSLKVEGMILNASIEQITDNFTGANSILNNALNLCEKEDIPYLTQKILREKDIFQNNIQLHQDVVFKNKSLSEKIDEAQLIEYVKKAKDLFPSEFRVNRQSK